MIQRIGNPCFFVGIWHGSRKSCRLGRNALLSEKGQVTTLKRTRVEMGLLPGSVLGFEGENGRIIVRKVLAENPI